ncbi:MAG TPA: hypothetical protein VGF23_00470 [Gaiellaceae bacterium]
MPRRRLAQQLELEVDSLDPPESKAAPKAAGRRHPPATELLARPGALLNRSHLRELGLERRAVDAVFRALPVVAIPGYSRPLIRAQDYLGLLEHHTFNGDRVRPIARPRVG